MKTNQTTTLEFEVVKPFYELESVGEILQL